MKLVVFDLDSTLIDAEPMNEFAKAVDREKEVSDITEKALTGDMKLEEALPKRVEFLTGLEVKKINEITKKILFMKGAETTVKELKKQGIKIGVISTGTDIVTEEIKKRLGIDYAIANELVIKKGKLTGEVKGPLVKEGSKGKVFEEIVRKAKVSFEDSVAVGNGANDISMFQKAGLAIAFNSKPVLKRFADVVVKEKDLRQILPHIFNQCDVKDLIKNQRELGNNISRSKKEIERLNSTLKDLHDKKWKLINSIKLENAKAEHFKDVRDRLNKEVREKKKLREEANAAVRELRGEYNTLIEKKPKIDFNRVEKEIKRMEWTLQTTVLKIKKEDEIVDRIKKLKEEIKGFEDLITISKKIDRLKKKSQKLHEKILRLSDDSQSHHENFLESIRRIREIEGKIEDINNKKTEVIASLEEKKKHLKDITKDFKRMKKKIELSENIINPNTDEYELKKRAKGAYEKFKLGEKLDLEDIYLLRRFNLV